MSREHLIVTLKKQWAALLPTVALPTDAQFALWLELHHFDVVAHGLRATAKKNIRLGFTLDCDRAVRYASGCMNRQSRENRELLELLAQNGPEHVTSSGT